MDACFWWDGIASGKFFNYDIKSGFSSQNIYYEGLFHFKIQFVSAFFCNTTSLLCRFPSIVVPRFISLNWIGDFEWDWKVSDEILLYDTRDGLHCASHGFQATAGSQIEKTFQGLDQRGLIGQWVNLIHSVIPTWLTSTKASSSGEAHEWNPPN